MDEATSINHQPELKRSAMAMANYGIAILDAQQRYLYMNDVHAQLYGYENSDDLVGQDWRIFYDDAELQRFEQSVIPLYLQQGFWRGEAAGRKQDGSLFDQEVSLTALPEGQMLCVVQNISDRKQTERVYQQQQIALRTTESRLQLITDSIPACIAYIDIQERYQFANQTYEQWFQLPRDQIVGMTVHDLLGEAAYGKVKPYLDRVFAGETVGYETEMHYRNGTQRWTSATFEPDRDEQGHVQGCYALVTDICDRKRLEADLRQSQQFLDSIIENAPFCIFTKDVKNDFRYTLINKNCEALMGFTREEALGKNDYELLPQKQADFHHAEDQSALALGTPIEVPEVYLERTDGNTLWGRSFKLPLYDSQGQPSHILGLAEDITERKQREEALQLMVEGTAAQTGNAFFRTCVQYLAQALRVRYALITEFIDPTQTRLRTIALWAGNAIGYNTELDITDLPSQGEPPEGICFYADNVLAHFPNCAALFKQGVESYLGLPLVNGAGQVLGYLAVLDTQPMERTDGRDIILRIFAARTVAEIERQRANRDLQKAKDQAEAADRAKSAFLANMSHELRTPLNAILGFAQLMEQNQTLSGQHRDFLNTINRSGAHLLDLINDVLEMSKLEAGHSTLNASAFDLHHLLQNLEDRFQIIASAKSLRLEVIRAAGVPQYVCSDGDKLRQILSNLLNNAIKFTTQGTITLRMSAQGNRLAAMPYALYVEVIDTGCGITDAERQKLFQPFVQTSRSTEAGGGTGLGLVISRRYAQLLGGNLHFTSIPNQGTTFYLQVQVRPAKVTDINNRGLTRQIVRLAPGQPEYRILMVDHQAQNRNFFTQLLSSVGFQVQAVASGQVALSRQAAWLPQMIWINLEMANNEGYTAIRRLRALSPSPLPPAQSLAAQPLAAQPATGAIEPRTAAPIIIGLTPKPSEVTQAELLMAGCDAWVSFPLDETIIFETIKAHLNAQFIYKATQYQPLLQTNVSHQVTLFARELEGLSIEWIRALHQAALAVDGQAIQQLLTTLPTSQQDLSNKLTQLIQRFDFDDILDATQVNLDRSNP